MRRNLHIFGDQSEMFCVNSKGDVTKNKCVMRKDKVFPYTGEGKKMSFSFMKVLTEYLIIIYF